MELYGMHFNYAGTSSRNYAPKTVDGRTSGYYIASVDEPRLTTVSGSAEITSIFNRRIQGRHYIDTNWDDSPLEFTMEIMSDNDEPLSVSCQRRTEKWLFHRNGFKKLYIDADDDCNSEWSEEVNGQTIKTYLNCIFTNPEKIEMDSGIYGYKFTVICDSPTAWQDPITQTVTPTSGVSFAIHVDTDMHEYVYPKLSITMGSSGGPLTIINYSDSANRLTSFAGLPIGATFVMDGITNYISGSNYTHFINKNFVRLLDGTNQIVATGDVASITFEWQNRRYL